MNKLQLGHIGLLEYSTKKGKRSVRRSRRLRTKGRRAFDNMPMHSLTSYQLQVIKGYLDWQETLDVNGSSNE